MKQIGILGGTFDPIHLGHIAIAKAARNQLSFDEIWFMPSKYPPHKTDHRIASEEDRCHMIRLAIEEEPFFKLSTFELQFEETTYTYRTLQRLCKEYPKLRFSFLIGADSLFQLEQWKHPERIMGQTELVVVPRDYYTPLEIQARADYLKAKYHASIRLIQMEKHQISSQVLRESLARGQEASLWIPEKVLGYIQEHHLYRMSEYSVASNEIA